MRFMLAGTFLMLSPLVHAETVNLYAAGSLKAALTEVTGAFVLGEAGQAILMKHGFGRGDPAK